MSISIESIWLLSLSLICILLPIGWVIGNGTRQNAYTLAQPIWLLALSVFFGTTFKIWYLLLLRQTNEAAILIPSMSDHVLYGADITSLLPGILAVLIGVSSYLFGYGLNKTSNFTLPLASNDMSSRWIYIFSIVFIVISVISLFLLAKYTGNENGYGQKIFNQLEGGSVNRLFHLEYYFYKFATLIRYSFYLLFIYFMTTKKLGKEKLLFCIVVYSLSAFITCYMGNRAHVVISMFDLIFFTAVIYIAKDMKQYRNKALISMVCSLFIISVVLVFTTSQIRYKNTDYVKGSNVLLKLKENLLRVQSDSNGALGEAIELLEQGKDVDPQQEKLLCEYVSELEKVHIKYMSETYWGTRAEQLLTLDTGEKSVVTDDILQLLGSDNKKDTCRVKAFIAQDELAEAKGSTILSIKQTALFEKILRGRYFLDILKTSRIINLTPSKVQYLYGETLYGWLFATVPRSIWPDKPVFMEISPMLSTVLFYEPKNNIPPGFVAELFLNFGWMGIIFGMFAIGFLSRYFYDTIVSSGTTPILILIYAMITVRFSIILFNTSFGDALLKSGLDLFPIFILYVCQVYHHWTMKPD